KQTDWWCVQSVTIRSIFGLEINMRTRIIWTKIWEDDWFQSLSDNAQKLFLYLLTNSRINMCGFYQISERVLLFDTRIKNLDKVKSELIPKVRFFEDWVYIVNAESYSG